MNNEVSSLELLLLVGPNNSSLLDFSNLVYWVFFFFLVGRFLSIMFNSLQSKRKEEEKEKKSALPSVMMKWDSPTLCESSTVI